ncbi:hypothetical protein EXU29_18375 [Acinetobacter wuhouensis]|uniref:hypothetical protein n=1 Tax=Acinetobacter wuhouensis TaxID=1879050 RepID=UPI0010231118|nr:hypothetical protein [Acinetobacter wuhouensis]RZG66676.1 hypothetical protein EXU29_18375 [Acinetobacter wuhouensis]
MHACELLSEPNADGLQVCLKWVVINQSILPPLSLTEATILGTSFWLVLVVAKGFREFGYFIKKF